MSTWTTTDLHPRLTLRVRPSWVRWLVAIAVFLTLLPRHADAGGLMLYPTRIVFEKNQRTAQVEIVNNSNASTSYRIALVNRRMNEAGGFSAATDKQEGENFADGLLRYSPRHVMLAPGASQVVRLQLRKPADLAPGEYRSHLQFTELPNASPAPNAAASDAASDAVEIKLQPLLGTSIPVIVRHGETAASATLVGPRLEPGNDNDPPVVAFEIHRDGNRSLYGNVIVTHVLADGAREVLAHANGVAVYVPNPKRVIRIALPSARVPKGGAIQVDFQAPPESGGQLLASTRLPLE